jgi:O-acetyl-ADP-ribose deacetylase (regulator of RNase III)
MKVTFQHTDIELKTGDITQQPDVDAIVNAANAELRIGGGVAGAIHRIGDPELTRETRPLAPIRPGEAVITSAPNLPNKHIIHCLGPVYGRDVPSDKLLANCYRNALELGEEYELESIAFPAISTGAFGYPKRDAAKMAFTSIHEKAESLEFVKLIRFVLFDNRAFEVHKEELEQF